MQAVRSGAREVREAAVASLRREPLRGSPGSASPGFCCAFMTTAAKRRFVRCRRLSFRRETLRVSPSFRRFAPKNGASRRGKTLFGFPLSEVHWTSDSPLSELFKAVKVSVLCGGRVGAPPRRSASFCKRKRKLSFSLRGVAKNVGESAGSSFLGKFMVKYLRKPHFRSERLS